MAHRPSRDRRPPSRLCQRGRAQSAHTLTQSAVHSTCPARVAEWQTRWTQNPLSARTCGFKSRPGHQSRPRRRLDPVGVPAVSGAGHYPSVTGAGHGQGLPFDFDARVHLPRPGLAAPRHGPAVARPRELGARRGGRRHRRARRRPAAARRRRRRAEGHPQRPADHVRARAWWCSTPSSASASSRATAPATASASTPRSPPPARSASTTACASSPSGARPCRTPAPSTPGTMAAVLGLDDDQVEVACRRADGDVWVANYNAPGQVVIAGSPEGVAAAGVRRQGARRQEGDAAAGVAARSTRRSWRRPATGCARRSPRPTRATPRCRSSSNVDALPHDQRRGVGRACSSAQLAQPGALEARPARRSRTAGVTDFVELGPGGVLTGMAKRTVDRRPHALGRRRPTTSTSCSSRCAGRPPSAVGAARGRAPLRHRAARRQPGGRRLHAASEDSPTARRSTSATCSATSATTRCARRSPACCRATSPSTASGSPPASPSPGCARTSLDDARRSRPAHEAPSSPDGAPPCPTRCVTNARPRGQLLDTTDEWIVERTGIRERRVGGTTAGAVDRGRAAGARAWPASTRPTIDVLVLATTTPDQTVPATVGRRCRTRSGCAAARSTSTPPAPASSTRLVVAHGLIAIGRRAGAGHRHRHAVAHHRLGRPQHRHPVRRRLRRRRARGRRRAAASCSAGTSTPTARAERCLYADVGGYIQMDGKEVFRRAVRIMVDSAEKSMEHAGVTRRRHRAASCPTRPTSASSRPPASASASPMERAAIVLDHTGNTSSASIPLALADALDAGRVARRRPRAARRLRRRHDARPARVVALGRATRRRVTPRRSCSSPAGRGASAWPAPSAFAAAGDQVAVTYRTLRRRPTGCSRVKCDVTSTRRRSTPRSPRSRSAFGPVRGARGQRRHHQATACCCG